MTYESITCTTILSRTLRSTQYIVFLCASWCPRVFVAKYTITPCLPLIKNGILFYQMQTLNAGRMKVSSIDVFWCI